MHESEKFFSICWHDCELVLDCKLANSDNFKDVEIGDFGRKRAKIMFSKLIVGLR